MELNELERFALEMLFKDSALFYRAIQENLATATVIEREFTGVGFFSTIQFLEPLPDLLSSPQRDWNFLYPGMSHGGSFMGWRESDNTIGLEGVSHIGAWPTETDVAKFSKA